MAWLAVPVVMVVVVVVVAFQLPYQATAATYGFVASTAAARCHEAKTNLECGPAHVRSATTRWSGHAYIPKYGSF